MRRRETAPVAPAGRVRIIGGVWRGRVLAFRATTGLRPTPDRVRETLFNWLQPRLDGAHCLDLFCGSGALGLEALSRGAARSLFVDNSPAAIADLRDNIERLGASGAEACTADVPAWLAAAQSRRFDIVFVDPPYRCGLAERCIALLAGSGLLAPRALVYLESGADEPLPTIPSGWALHRDKRAGQVAYRLLTTPLQ